MIAADLSNCKTLQEFYDSICSQQKKAHGENYCNHHRAIEEYGKECTTYKELGIYQGATLACALLMNFKEVHGIDLKLEKYSQYLKPIAEEYARENRIRYTVRGMSSTHKDSLSTTDMLLIDTLHHASHLKKELYLHASSVNKYIIAHDTWSSKELHQCLEDFCKNNDWNVIERDTSTFGHTVIKRN